MPISTEWIQLAGAVGIGAIATKLLDVLWLQRVLQDSERTRWLREQRYRVYAELSRTVLSSGPFLYSTTEREFLGLIADAQLITEDQKLIEMLQSYYPSAVAAQRRLDLFINNGSSTIEQREALRLKESEAMLEMSDRLLTLLRKSL